MATSTSCMASPSRSISSRWSASGFPYEVWHYKYIAGIGDNVDLTFVDTCQCGDYHYTIDPMEKKLAALAGPAW